MEGFIFQVGGQESREWVLGDGFFEGVRGEMEAGEMGILGGEVRASVEMRGREVMVEFEGEVRVECDRCGEECGVRVEGEDGFKVEEGETEVDVAWFIYESIVLAMPLKRVHERCELQLPEGVEMVGEDEFQRAEAGSEMQKMADNPEWQKLAGLKDKLE